MHWRGHECGRSRAQQADADDSVSGRAKKKDERYLAREPHSARDCTSKTRPKSRLENHADVEPLWPCTWPWVFVGLANSGVLTRKCTCGHVRLKLSQANFEQVASKSPLCTCNASKAVRCQCGETSIRYTFADARPLLQYSTARKASSSMHSCSPRY